LADTPFGLAGIYLCFKRVDEISREYASPGFGKKYLVAPPASERAECKESGPKSWKMFIDALEDEQEKAGPRAAALIKYTREHLLADAPDMSSVEAACIICQRRSRLR